jgi:hypothetical protein
VLFSFEKAFNKLEEVKINGVLVDYMVLL